MDAPRRALTQKTGRAVTYVLPVWEWGEGKGNHRITATALDPCTADGVSLYSTSCQEYPPDKCLAFPMNYSDAFEISNPLSTHPIASALSITTTGPTSRVIVSERLARARPMGARSAQRLRFISWQNPTHHQTFVAPGRDRRQNARGRGFDLPQVLVKGVRDPSVPQSRPICRRLQAALRGAARDRAPVVLDDHILGPESRLNY